MSISNGFNYAIIYLSLIESEGLINCANVNFCKYYEDYKYYG